ncbi:MAG: DUF6350 family protein, partial [Bifidobacteriaceae bacterium]|nr:DUF6350 family protein [Bifidobacteriaceae bacterium]
GSLQLTIAPLLLTILLIWLIATFVRRTGANVLSYIAGLCTWVGMNAYIFFNTHVGFVDSLGGVCLKTTAVFSAGYVLGTYPSIIRAIPRNKIKIPQYVLIALRRGITLCAYFCFAYILIGFITVIIWCFVNGESILHQFVASDIHIGSRIFIIICAIAWLPNLSIWAMSWLFGGGFSFGKVTTFSLWGGDVSKLPTFAIFNMFPSGMPNDLAREFFMLLPTIISVIVSLLFIWSPRIMQTSLPSIPIKPAQIRRYVSNAIALFISYFCTIVCIVFITAYSCILSDGSLGKYNLSFIGTNVLHTTQIISRSTMIGLFTGLGITCIIISGYYAFHTLTHGKYLKKNQDENTPEVKDNSDVEESSSSSENITQAIAVQSQNNMSTDEIQETHEAQDDENAQNADFEQNQSGTDDISVKSNVSDSQNPPKKSEENAEHKNNSHKLKQRMMSIISVVQQSVQQAYKNVISYLTSLFKKIRDKLTTQKKTQTNNISKEVSTSQGRVSSNRRTIARTDQSHTHKLAESSSKRRSVSSSAHEESNNNHNKPRPNRSQRSVSSKRK